jgi:hypothetical protein
MTDIVQTAYEHQDNLLTAVERLRKNVGQDSYKNGVKKKIQ